MTAGELVAALAAMPQNAAVFVLFDRETAILAETGDIFYGKPTGYYEPERCFLGKCFYVGDGFCPAVLLSLGEEV